MHHTLTGPMRWRWTPCCAESHGLRRSAEAGAPVGRGAVGADQVRAGRDEGRPRICSAHLAAAATAHGALNARQRVLKGQPRGLIGIHCKHRQPVSPERPRLQAWLMEGLQLCQGQMLGRCEHVSGCGHALCLLHVPESMKVYLSHADGGLPGTRASPSHPAP